MNAAGYPSLLVLGTDTGVGKTVVTSLLLAAYKTAGVTAVPFKPVVSGLTTVNGRDVYADTKFLAAAAGIAEERVGLYRFPDPLSPHLAAERAGKPVDPDKIIGRFHELQAQAGAVIVEGVGGVMVPLIGTMLFIDLAARFGVPAVIVARPGLGTINHTLLTVEACRARGITLAGLIVNRYPGEPNEAERTNPAQLAALTGLPILGLVPEVDLAVQKIRPAAAGVFNGFNLAPLGTTSGRRLSSSISSHLPGDGAERDGTGRQDVPADFTRAVRADADYVWHPFSPMLEYLSEKPHPLMIVGGEGCRLIDSDGRRYLDGISSLWVNVHGHRHPALNEAIRGQLDKIAHSTLLGMANEPSALLAEKLVEITPPGLEKVFYSDSGSTAVEIALKVAFQFQQQTGRPEKQEFISFTNAYHGDTVGAVSVGGHELFHSLFKPLLFKTRLVPAAYCYRCPVESAHPDCDFGCLTDLKETLRARADRTAAVIFEPKVQGAAGILVQPPGYMRRVADLCRAHDVLLIADEVATGFGRTGPLFACQLEGIEPDIMTVAKGITGGYLPLAATLFRREIYEAFLGKYEEMKTFFHGHSYTGNPLASAAALANIKLLRETDVLDRARERAAELAQLLAPLAAHGSVGEIRQCGLMVGIELVEDKKKRRPFPVADRVGRAVALKARESGVIIRPLGDVVVLMPPLAMTAADLRELVDATTLAVNDVAGTGEVG